MGRTSPKKKPPARRVPSRRDLCPPGQFCLNLLDALTLHLLALTVYQRTLTNRSQQGYQDFIPAGTVAI